MEAKKISFGFSKTSKKPEIFSTPPEETKEVELIDCLEGQSIKIKDAVEVIKGPLIIPIKETSKNLIDRVKEVREKRIKIEPKKEEEAELPESALSIDELAARELIREAKNRDSVKTETKVFSLPLSEEKFVAEGEKEPSIEDYESVPISDYGMAMLRGMGWNEGMPIGKTHSKVVTPILPELRPKGLGLGANKMVNANTPAQAVDKDGKELRLIKGAYGKIIAGNHKGHYCEVQGLDDENCRVIVKTALTNNILSLNEFLIVPVTKEEYAIGSKVINNAKYEEYKEKSSNRRLKKERSRSRKRSRKQSRSRSRSRDKYKNKHGEKSGASSENDHQNETDDSESSRDQMRHRSNKLKKKSKEHRNNSHSRESNYDRRRKGKKKSKSRH